MPEGFCSCDELREKGACGEMRSETNKEFPMRLRRLREQKRMKRRVLGELCGLGKNAIGRYERGEREPALSAVVALADFFGVSVDYMLGKDENQSQKKNRKKIFEVVPFWGKNAFDLCYDEHAHREQSLEPISRLRFVILLFPFFLLGGAAHLRRAHMPTVRRTRRPWYKAKPACPSR